jgi:cytohesin
MSNPEVNFPTPLHLAAYNCDFERLVDLLQSGADPNARNKGGFTALHWCAFRGLVGTEQHLIAKALLRAGADLNACTASGDCPLCLAIESSNQLLVKVLVEEGSDVNLVANDVTPLMTAARVGNFGMVRFLLQARANPNVACGRFRAVDYADYYGHDEIAAYLKAGA